MSIKKLVDEEIKTLIRERIEKIKNPKASAFFLLHPDYPETQKEKDRQSIIELLQRIELIHQQIQPYIRTIKNHIKNITERTRICAIYLLFGKVIQTWDTIFLIAKEGRNQEVMELVRSINENLNLISLFILDNTNNYLNRWFDGEIIENSEAREVIDNFINSENPIFQEELPVYEINTYIYRILSKYTHGSYAALLDSVDVFNKDFDFYRFAGFHYTRRNFHVLKDAMVGTLIQLKALYLFLKDNDNYIRIDNILTEIMPKASKEEMKNIFKKFK